MIARAHLRTLTDLRGRTVALQQCGPHLGLLDDVLRSVQLTWDDIKIVWTKDLTASADSPAEVFRDRADVDACFTITPDMVSLCGGSASTGTGAGGTVNGARVLVSTAQLSRSIADVYVCRKDFFDGNKEMVTKFVTGYLKACEEIIELRKQHEAGGSAPYRAFLQMTQDIYGKRTIPELDDAHGLLADCTFAGYPGNVAFFTAGNNLIGFDAMQVRSLDLALSRGYARERLELLAPGFDYKSPQFLDYLTRTDLERGERFRAEAVQSEIEMLSSGGALDERTILALTIHFEPNQTEFSATQYGTEFQRVVETATRFGNAVIVVRGHADPTKTLLDLVRAGMARGVLKRTGTAGNYTYSFDGQPFDLSSTADLVRLIEQGAFDGASEANPRETMQAALNLSRNRAEQVLAALVEYARSKGFTIDQTQIMPVGVGIREPFIAKPSNLDEARQNMRVEFRVIRVAGEAAKPSDFDF
jgi:outer membrane protein OmpA-like peptidoglycan-associated protein